MIRLFIIFLFSCISSNPVEYEFNYDLNKPDAVIQLPAELNEISGLTDIDNKYIACTQDELGIIYIVNINTGKIENKYQFEPIGDFEGLTNVDGTFYILRSDGRITFLPDYSKPNEHIHIKESLPTKNNEGLCYDMVNNRLLIAAKSKPLKNTEYQSEKRLIYQYDLNRAVLDTVPIFTLNVSDISSFAGKNNIKLPVSSIEKANKKVNFRPSSLAVHPVSQNIYVISAADFLLAVCDKNGQILKLKVLDPELFQKAEGITFLPDNTMIITNEANNKIPTLLKFSFNKI